MLGGTNWIKIQLACFFAFMIIANHVKRSITNCNCFRNYFVL